MLSMEYSTEAFTSFVFNNKCLSLLLKHALCKRFYSFYALQDRGSSSRNSKFSFFFSFFSINFSTFFNLIFGSLEMLSGATDSTRFNPD